MKILLVGEDPGNPNDLLVPLARVVHIPNPGTTLRDIAELPYRLGGRAAKPSKPLLMMDRTGRQTAIAGLGVTEAAELQDMAYRLHERGPKYTDENWREQFGLQPREGMVERIREHMAYKAKWFKQHPITGRHGFMRNS